MLLNPRPQMGGMVPNRFGSPMAPRPISRPMPQYPMSARPILGSFKHGGKVKKTGIYKLHAGEKVMSLKQLMKG